MKRAFAIVDHVSDLWMVGAVVCFSGALALFFGGLAGAAFAGAAQFIFGLSNEATKSVWEVSAIVWFPIPLGMFISAARSLRVKSLQQRAAEEAAGSEQRA